MTRFRPAELTVTFDPRLAAYAVVSAIVLVVPFAPMDSDTGAVLHFLAFAVNGVAIASIAARARGLRLVSVVLMSTIYLVVSIPLVLHFDDVHTLVKWRITRSAVTANLLAQANRPNHELRHVDWDAWGFAGMETDVYVVYDPDDSLLAASTRGVPGRYAGIPCEVPQVRRLERHFYAVRFYTETGWDVCGNT